MEYFAIEPQGNTLEVKGWFITSCLAVMDTEEIFLLINGKKGEMPNDFQEVKVNVIYCIWAMILMSLIYRYLARSALE